MEYRSIPFFKPSIDQCDLDAFTTQLSSGWLTRGGQCNEFERRFCEAVRSEHAISTNSCTAALITALIGQNIRHGDCVILPDLTFTATAEAVLRAGGTPVLVDSTQDTLCIDPYAVQEAVSALQAAGRTVSFVIPVHYGGTIADVETIDTVAKSFGLKVVHDAAHCLESTYFDHARHEWRALGELFGSVCYSFYANKCITTCEGGMITTNDSNAAERLRALSLHGIQGPRFTPGTALAWNYDVAEVGVKANLADPLAALGISQLARSKLFHEQRTAIANRYDDMLSHLPIDVPIRSPDRKSSWHLYVIRIAEHKAGITRDDVYEHMAARGIQCSVHWKPLSQHSAYRALIKTGQVLKFDCPTTDAVWSQLLSLPIYPGLTEGEQYQVCQALNETFIRES